MLVFSNVMANVIVVGAQWGDEGKAKIVDLLSSRYKKSQQIIDALKI